jgi:hypothetical protein
MWRVVVCDQEGRGYSPARGLQNTNPQWVVATVKKNIYMYKGFKLMSVHSSTLFNHTLTQKIHFTTF